MGQDKKQLTKLLQLIKELYNNDENIEFAEGLDAIVLNRLAITTNDEIEKIKNALELRADPSIDYSFVKNTFVQRQLIVDNLRMENVLLNLSLFERERYDNFCVNAFLQVENILNYFYCEKYSRVIDDILTEIEDATKNDRYPFKREPKKTYHYVSEINVYNKIQAFCNRYFPLEPDVIDYTLINLQKLRSKRNDIFHRAGDNEVSKKEATGKDKPMPTPTTPVYRDTLIRLVHKVKELL